MISAAVEVQASTASCDVHHPIMPTAVVLCMCRLHTQELGRPRIDVLASLSGIFRDSFANVVDLLDDVFETAASAADEPTNMNYIRWHEHRIALKQFHDNDMTVTWQLHDIYKPPVLVRS